MHVCGRQSLQVQALSMTTTTFLGDAHLWHGLTLGRQTQRRCPPRHSSGLRPFKKRIPKSCFPRVWPGGKGGNGEGTPGGQVSVAQGGEMGSSSKVELLKIGLQSSVSSRTMCQGPMTRLVKKLSKHLGTL